MATSTIMLFLVILVVSAVVTGFLVSVVNRWLEVPSANFFNATIAALVVVVVAVVMSFVRGILEGWLPGTASYSPEGVTVGSSWVLLAVQFLVTVGVALWITKVVMFAHGAEALKAGLALLVVGGLITCSMLLLVDKKILQRLEMPSDAMAPNIVSAHARIKCDGCGYQYVVGAPNPEAAKNVKVPAAYASTCPYCGHADSVPAEAAIYRSDSLTIRKGGDPERWNLVLLKASGDAAGYRVGRVVGLPGETVEIADGKLFAHGKRLQRGPGEVEDMWVPVYDSQFAPAQVQPKSDVAQWKGSRAWKREDNQWTCVNEKAEAERLTFAGKITDRTNYNLNPDGSAGPDATPRPVGDIKLELSIASLANGTMSIEWAYYDQGLSATISPAGDVELTAYDRSSGSSRRVASERGHLANPITRSARLTFAVRDGRAYLTEQGSNTPVAKVAIGPQDLETVKQTASDTDDFCRLTVSVASGTLSLSRLQLYRDVYYRRLEGLSKAVQAMADKKYLRDERSVATFKLGSNAYFVLADNSTRGKDSRMFGPVTRDEILGIPQGISWPLKRRHLFQ